MEDNDDDIMVTHCKAINNILHCQSCFTEAVQDFNALEDSRRECFMRWAAGKYNRIMPNCERG